MGTVGVAPWSPFWSLVILLLEAASCRSFVVRSFVVKIRLSSDIRMGFVHFSFLIVPVRFTVVGRAALS